MKANYEKMKRDFNCFRDTIDKGRIVFARNDKYIGSTYDCGFYRGGFYVEYSKQKNSIRQGVLPRKLVGIDKSINTRFE